jgi:hypothetical protein
LKRKLFSQKLKPYFGQSFFNTTTTGTEEKGTINDCTYRRDIKKEKLRVNFPLTKKGRKAEGTLLCELTIMMM